MDGVTRNTDPNPSMPPFAMGFSGRRSSVMSSMTQCEALCFWALNCMRISCELFARHFAAGSMMLGYRRLLLDRNPHGVERAPDEDQRDQEHDQPDRPGVIEAAGGTNLVLDFHGDLDGQ